MIVLTENGFILHNDKVVSNSFVLTVLGQDIQLDSQFSMRSLFMLLNNYPSLAKMNLLTHEYLDIFNSISQETVSQQETKNEIVFNTFIISNLPLDHGKKFNLVVKNNNFNKNYKLSNYHLSELINCPLRLNTIAFPVSFTNGIVSQYGIPLEIFNPCNLFEFIESSCYAIFRNKTPQDRTADIKLVEHISELLADDVLHDISCIISGHN